MAFLCLFQCRVGPGLYSPQSRPPTAWTAQDITDLQGAGATPLRADGWQLLEQQQQHTQRWAQFDKAHALPALEQQLEGLEKQLEKARKTRKQFARSAPISLPKPKERGLFGWLGRSSSDTDQNAQALAQAQQALETAAREHSHAAREVQALVAQRWALTFADMPTQILWFTLPLSGTAAAQLLAAKGLGSVWPSVPELALQCPIGRIPEDTDGRPGERASERWYFRTGLLAQRLLGPQETAAERQNLQELELWITNGPAQASVLALELHSTLKRV